jgi:hypothetical protein
MPVNPVNGLVAINGYPGQLQMVDVSVSGLAAALESSAESSSSSVPCAVTDSVQVVSYNRVSRIDNAVTGWDKPHRSSRLYVPSVSLFKFHSFSSDKKAAGSRRVLSKSVSHYLATVDVTRGEEFGPESSLKIWKWDYTSPSGPQFRLITQADRPHGPHRLTALAFFTTGEGTPGLATSDSDGSVKIWTR